VGYAATGYGRVRAVASTQCHGHVLQNGSHVLFVGRVNKARELLVQFKGSSIFYAYELGDSYQPRLCCELAKSPSPGTFIARMLTGKFPYKRLG
jgi:hypothetical protein